MASLWKTFRFFCSLFREYKFLTVTVLILIVITEILAFADKIVLKLFIDKGNAFVAGTLSQSTFVSFLLYMGLIFAIAIIIRAVLRYVLLQFVNKIEAGVIADLKRMMYSFLMNLSARFHVNNKTGSIISRLMRSSGAVEGLCDVFLYNFLPLFISTLFVVSSLIILEPLSATVIILFIAVFLWYTYYIQIKQQPHQETLNDADDAEKAFVSDTFTNVEPIKMFGKEHDIIHKFIGITQFTANKTLRFWKYYPYQESGQQLIVAAGIFSILAINIYQFVVGNAELGTTVFAFTLFLQLSGQLYGFSWGLRGMYRTLIDLESLRQYLDEKVEIVDTVDAKPISITKGNIAFENVEFQYKEHGIINDLTFNVKSKKRVALVGHSGSGKSTLVRLLLRLYDLNGGTIKIDGQDISLSTQESLRSQISVVPQECILFDDTLENNIRFAQPNATAKELQEAIKAAQLERFVSRLENGLQTIVGERGVKLSGGEKQRVSIARALLAKRPIIILDEPTSALDSQTENEIQKALKRLLVNKTSIIIAHRLSTIMTADEIIVLKDGKIVQQGTHNSLLRKKGEYKDLWNLQRGGYIE